MSKKDNDDIYSDDYISDPIAAEAAREAVAATEPNNPHPWVNRVVTVLAVLVLLMGTLGLVLGAINSIKLSNQNDQLKRQQACTSQLLINFEKDQAVRQVIAADDRRAVDDMVKAVASAKKPGDVAKAFNTYNVERKANETRRNNYPPTTSPTSCLTPEQLKSLQIPLPSGSLVVVPATTKPSSRGPKSNSKATPSAARPTTGSQPKNSPTANSGPQQPGPGKVVTTQRIITIPGVTVTRVATVPALPIPTSIKPLAPLPKCSLSVGVINVC